MPDRLEELRRQRALVQQHLAWLDREIAHATTAGTPASPDGPVPADDAAPMAITRPAAASGSTTVPAPRTVSDPDAILAQYRTESTSLKRDVRQGCLLYFVAALALLAVGVMVLYYLLPRR